MNRLFDRADAILKGKANGHALPILEALSIRGHLSARNALATILTDPRRISRKVEVERALKLMRTDAFGGDAAALYNLAIHYRNTGDMRRYRHWLARAVRRSGDPHDVRELHIFETRFPHAIMRRFRRLRPYRKRDA
ncbi:hypothetical protein [Sphingomonas montana]|uniref:hypothetical protein n=1 Tax=Sphingomonas montana TaxID=1843236 RepID=UPI00101AE794|nr:hypothetical protein [Sphingomonas montana]